ncbi:MAG: S8 family serine peptidase [Muribaculaceae bacterium]|nr:S8 family serine peptidase [Muribaculaceae bacterium]
MKHSNLFKSLLLAIALLLGSLPIAAQQMVSNDNDDEVYKVEQYAPKYRPNQVIVKFKESSPVTIKSDAKGKFMTSSVSSIDKVMSEIGVLEAEQLMPLTGAIKNRAPRKAKALSGREVIEPDLSKLYCMKLDSTIMQRVEDVVERLKALDEVEYAEPNYLAFIQSVEDSTAYVSEPMYSQQWGLDAINMPQLWAMEKVETERPVIAILDTGVDITHPDLTDNIWTNSREDSGASYEDDDNNGYVDDIHGWDFIAGTAIIGNGMDRNGHGTHCAGIAAAVGDNEIGITGANPDALILPIKVMGDDGTGDIATICRGIDYAVACGAHVLSMSFGSSIPSAAEYQALSKALTNYAVMVGASGNAGSSIYTPYGCSYPGMYDIVIGVMASDTDGQRAVFSNYDPDGPFFSKYNMNKAFSSEVTWNDEMMWNYDLMAPGVNILSTYLNGSYKTLNGTSMATPMVAGAISLILQVKGYDYARDYGLMGDMAIAKDGGLTDLAVFNAYQAASFDETNRQVALALISLEIDDSEGEGDGDGRFDAGENISIWPTIRSLWGHAENIKIAIEPYDENTPTDAIEILDNNVDFGWSLNSRGSFKSKNPIRVHVNENAYDGMHLPYKIVITSDNLLAGIEQEHVFEVENGVELGGVINEDMTLYPNKHYIATKSIAIPQGKTLTIMPGTRLEFNEGCCIQSDGKLIANGNPDSLIVFTSRDPEKPWGGIRSHFSSSDNPCDTIAYCFLVYVNYGGYYPCLYIKNCILDKMNERTGGNYWIMHEGAGFDGMYNNFLNSYSYYNGCMKRSNSLFYSNFINFRNREDIPNSWQYSQLASSNLIQSGSDNEWSNLPLMVVGRDNGITIDHAEWPSWLGTSKEEIIRPYIYDSKNPLLDCFTTVDLSNMPTRPYKEAHGIVWKVMVDGYDAQDEFDQLPPLGVGRHKFEVYYNRDDIDTTFTPTVSMGFREPYTQTPINKDGFWCAKDSASVYTVFLDITGKTNCDGLNRIKVTGGKDHDHFDVPDEYWRFNVFVQAAGSMATGFAAEAGLGKVNLTWNNENNDFEDAMGFNVYRYSEEEKLMPVYDEWGNEVWEEDENGYWVPKLEMQTVRDTVRLNEMILDLDTDQFTDYEVTPGKVYYYYYKVLSTDLKEYDISNVVAASPLTSVLGDANASGEVDVADVITTVNYAAGMEPRPFLFEAADVNMDQDIDILDVIGIIKLITNPNANVTAMAEAEAIYSVENGVVYVDCPVELAGVQVMLNANPDATITPTEDLNGFEKVSAWLADNQYLFMAYNMAGRTIPAGKHALLSIGDASISDIRLADKQGHNVRAYMATPTVIDVIPADRTVRHSGIYDLMGRKIADNADALRTLQPGIYIVNGQKVVKK